MSGGAEAPAARPGVWAWPTVLAVAAAAPLGPLAFLTRERMLATAYEASMVLPAPTALAMQSPAAILACALFAIGLNVAAARSAQNPKGILAMLTTPPLARFGGATQRDWAFAARGAIGIVTAAASWLMACFLVVPALHAAAYIHDYDLLRAWPAWFLAATPIALLVLVQLRHAGRAGTAAIGAGAAGVTIGICAGALAIGSG